MKVWEAIEMLMVMDGNKEVTVTMGKPKAQKIDEYQGFHTYTPSTREWVLGKEFWPQRNEITCKMH